MAQRNTVQQKIIAGQLAKLHGSHPPPTKCISP